jgi:hypothetical protein
MSEERRVLSEETQVTGDFRIREIWLKEFPHERFSHNRHDFPHYESRTERKKTIAQKN